MHYVGLLVRFSPVRGVGVVRSESGREIPFDLRFCQVAGEPRGIRSAGALDVGLSVAFDVGWTSSGLRATWIKPLTVEDPASAPAAEKSTG